MKKWISLCIALALAFSLAACGGSDVANSGEKATSDAADTTVDAAVGNAETAEGGAETQAGEQEAAPAGPVYGATIEEQVVLDDAENGIKVTATGMRVGTKNESISPLLLYRQEDGIGVISVSAESEYLYIDFTVENTSDKNYTVTLDDMAVDGCPILERPSLDNEMEGNTQLAVFAAGTTGQASAQLSCEALADYNIETISDIAFTVRLYDKESRKSLYYSDLCTLTTSAYKENTGRITPEGDILYDEDGITVILGKCSFDEHSFRGNQASGQDVYYVPLYVYNQTENTIFFENADIESSGKEYLCFINAFNTELAPGICVCRKLYVNPVDYSSKPFIDEKIDTYEVPFAMEIVHSIENENGGYQTEPIVTLNDITVTFDDSESETYWADLPTSKEEAEARYGANS